MTAEQIAAGCRERAASLREQATRLEMAADILDPMPDLDTLDREAEEFIAPFGYKKDGTPRKRRVPSRETQARSIATRRRKGLLPPKPKETRLRILSQTHPTAKELEDREVAHTTEEPA